MVYVCEECKEEFRDIKHKGRRFCSRKCFDEFRKKIFREEVKCEQCGVKMIRNKCFKRRFCCHDCYSKSLKGGTPWNKGRKETRKEVLKKLSDSHIGLQMGENNGNYGKEPWNKGLTYSRPEMSGENHPMYGKKHTKESKEKIRIGHLGKRHSLETRRKMSEGRKGDKTNFWKGGVTEENALIRTTLEIKLWKEAVFERDNWTCQYCERRGGELNAHHIKPFAKYPELRTSIENGVTLCVNCHKGVHKSINLNKKDNG